MDKLQISQIIKELISQGYPEPIIGGTCSLFLQGFDIEPGDIDLYYTISKENFLHQIHYRKCPRFPISIDWNFYPNLDLGFQEIEIEGVKLRIQKIEDVLNYKLEGLEEDYFPESKRDKHLRFFQRLISDPRVSSYLRSRINQILNIMRVEDLCVECRVSDILEFFKQESPLSGGKGPLTPERKKEIEDRLSNEANKFKGMWCVPGDYPSEGAPRSNPEMRPHRKAVKSIVKNMISKDSKLGWDDGYGAIYAPKATWKKALDQYEKSQKEFHDSLCSIKEQLFDAPDEIKKSFNQIIGYFDDNYFSDSYDPLAEKFYIVLRTSDEGKEYMSVIRGWISVYVKDPNNIRKGFKFEAWGKNYEIIEGPFNYPPASRTSTLNAQLK